MSRGKHAIPERWRDYSSFGKPLHRINIIPCKVPLENVFVDHLGNKDERFTPDVLMKKIKNIGWVVDLTNTNKYYDPQVFTNRGIRYKKIRCEGRAVPSELEVSQFFEVVDEFLRSKESDRKVMMVHCTHGVNRTGYLVSRYLIEQLEYTPANAIAMFQEARGHPIERYLSDLYSLKSLKRGNGVSEKDVQGKKRPRGDGTSLGDDKDGLSGDPGDNRGSEGNLLRGGHLRITYP